MEKQDEHKQFLNGYFLSLYYFSAPLAFILLLFLSNEFVINTLTYSLCSLDIPTCDNHAISLLDFIGWLLITKFILLVSFFTCILSMLVYFITSDTFQVYDSDERKEIVKRSHGAKDYNIFVFVIKIFSLKFSKVLSLFFVSLMVFIVIHSISILIAIIPSIIIMNVFNFDYTYYGVTIDDVVFIITQSFTSLFFISFIARKLLNSSVENMLI